VLTELKKELVLMLGKASVPNRKTRKRKFAEKLFTEDSISKIVPPLRTDIPEPDFHKNSNITYMPRKPVDKK
jgi:hypothetical protein